MSLNLDCNPIDLQQRNIQAAEALRETAMRRKINGELAEIRLQLDKSKLHDEMTQQLDNWHKNFHKAFSTNKNLENVVAQYVREMQEILRDSLSHVPLDEKAVLGSDDHTYSYMALTLHAVTTPLPFRNRSPMDPNNETAFTTIPHPNVQCVVQWLKKYNALLRNEKMEHLFRQLLEQNGVAMRQQGQAQAAGKNDGSAAAAAVAGPQAHLAQPMLAFVRSDIAPNTFLERLARLKKIKEGQAEQDNKANREKADFEKEMRRQTAQNMQILSNGLAQIDQQTRNREEQALEQISAIEQQTDIQFIDLDQGVKQLEQQAAFVEDEEKMFEKYLVQLEERIPNDIQQLQREIDQAREAIEKLKKKKNRLKKVINVAVVIGNCALATWGLSGIRATPAAGKSMGVAVLPTRALNGAKLAVTIPW